MRESVVGVAVGVAVGFVDDVQPLIETRTREPTKSKGNAYLSGVLMYRFIILAIGFIDSSPAVVNDVVFAGDGNGNAFALDAATGALKWNYATGNYMEWSPAVVNGVMYIGTGTGDFKFYALNATNGALKWIVPHVNPNSSPAVVNGSIYIGGGNPYAMSLYALDSATGALKWKYDTGYWVASSPAYANGVVYVGSEDSYLYALDAATGALRWKFGTNEQVPFSPVVASGVVYVADGDHIYAIGTQSPTPTTLTATVKPTILGINHPFTVNGTLATSEGSPVAGATIQLQKNVSGTWTNVNGKTDTTTSNGAYRISTSEPAAGTFQYRTTYTGNATYANATSSSLSVTVNGIPTPTPTPTPPPTPTAKPTVKPSPFGPTFPCNVPCPAVACADVCGAYAPVASCGAHTATASPASFLTLPSSAPLSHIPGVPEFPLAMAGAGVVAVALAGIYAAMRRRL